MPRYRLATLLMGVTGAALFCGLAACWGFSGVAYGAYAVVAMLGLARRLQRWGCSWARGPKWTIVEWLVVWGVCVVLHLLSFPAVTSECRPRIIAPVAAPTAVPPRVPSVQPQTPPGKVEGD